jgi:menaquinone-specific isochorismate synthase
VQALIVQTVLWLERLVASPACKPVQPSSSRPSSVPDRAGWQRLVEAIQGEIGRGGFQKIVAARRAVCQLEQAPAPEVVLARLGDIAHTCTRFALRHPGKLFLGATPEWLVRQHGRSVQTEAMAGSRRSAEPNAESQLLSSRKDLGEHALVVEEIVGALGPVATHLLVPSQPSVRRLRDILHLYTPIAATLTSDTHVIDLVERLHPTPAVGGTPHQAAQRWIAEHEPDERGWYASPVGWVNAAGDGQFVVALRSALLVDRLAHVFAGAGIVAESDAELEFEETELKLKAMLHALGAS